MNFDLSERCRDYQARLETFMLEQVYPAEGVYAEQMAKSDDPYLHPPVIEQLKREARRRGLWNLFCPPSEPSGPGFSNLEYAPLAEVMGRSQIAPEACNCSGPDTGNMELLMLFGSDEHKQRWLQPLLDGEIRSAFAMTEPGVPSSDARNIEMRIRRERDEYVLNGRKWWTSALHANCRLLIVMGKTDPEAPPHRQQSMLLVPIDTPGVTVKRGLSVFGYSEREGPAEVEFDEVRVPADHLLGGQGEGFMLAQARLGRGRIHHCMRSVGAAERALELMCRRASSRVTFGESISSRANVQDWIAESRTEIEMIRLLTLKTAWLIDEVGGAGARAEIAAIKVAAPNMALKVIDRAIQVHGAAGVSADTPLAHMWAHQRTLRLADGPDEVHRRMVAVHELRRWSESAKPVAAASPSRSQALEE